MRYREFRSYSPMQDRMTARISIAGPQAREYFATIRADEVGSRYRKRRQKACEAIAAAIAEGSEPGEVELDHDAVSAQITAEIEREKALAAT